MKTDSRVRYTKMVIKDGLLKLLSKKSIKNITVTEICKLAEINRATFYTHYRDPYDLLEQIEDELFEHISSTVNTKQDDIDNLIKEIFHIIETNIDLCKVLFSENGDKMFLGRIMDVSRKNSIAEWQDRYPRATKKQLDFIYTFASSGSIAVIEQWVQTGMQDTPLELGDIAKKVSDIWLSAI